jgi:peptidoglycan/LPS O-acetylase OafA/YrhL
VSPGVEMSRGPLRPWSTTARSSTTGSEAAWPPSQQRSEERHGATFRPDIQGLRAIAVLLVALSHANVPRLAGGYVGVDVFFVISGFLITGWLLRDSRDSGHPSFGRFYSARARRILPASALTLVATCVVCCFLPSHLEAVSAFHDAIWAAFFAANLHFAQVGTGYFAGSAPPSPVQHFWSLAVEEQFYVVWPALMTVVLCVFRRRAPTEQPTLRWRSRQEGGLDRAAMRRLTITLTVVAAASLTWSILTTSSDPTAAYFSTLARVWELGVGALIAVHASQLARLPARLRTVMGWLGLAGILVAATMFTPTTSFPGCPRALLPPCRRAYLYRPVKVGTMTPCDLGQRTLLERVVSTARRASPTMSSA